jgi:hypothetical protein
LYYLRGKVGKKARVRERRDGRTLSSAGARPAEQPADADVEAERAPEAEPEAKPAAAEPSDSD